MESSNSFTIPIQFIYDYIYNNNKPKKKQLEIKNKQI